MKYFEVINENGSGIVIDDSLFNVELDDIVPLKNATKREIYKDYIFTNLTYTSPIIGIGANELVGKSFCFSLMRSSDGLSISFFDNSELQHVFRDDIVEKGKLYFLKKKKRKPSEHLAGMEIYNENGDVVYTSKGKYLNVLGCGGDDAQTVRLEKNTVLFELGADHFTDIRIKHHMGVNGQQTESHPRFSINDNSVTVKKTTLNTLYVDDIGDDISAKHDFHASWCYGWMIASVI